MHHQYFTFVAHNLYTVRGWIVGKHVNRAFRSARAREQFIRAVAKGRNVPAYA